MNRYRNFSEKIIKKYSFFRKSGRLPALVFLRLFGLRETDRNSSLEKNTGSEWRINNYFEFQFHFYTGVIRKSIKTHENRHRKQYNVSFYRNIIQSGMAGGLVGQRSSASQKFFQIFGGSATSYPAVERKGLLPVFYTVTGSDKLTVKPTVKSTVKLTVLPARHMTGSHLQNIFNIVNTGSGSPATATKELLMNKSKNVEADNIPVLQQNVSPVLQQSVRNHDGNIPQKYEKNGKNILFPVLVPITSPAKTVLDPMNPASNGHSQITSARDGLEYNKTTLPSGIHDPNKESRSSELILTRVKTLTYGHVPSERADTGLIREERFVKTVLKRNIFTGLTLNVQKMNERLSGRERTLFPDNIVPEANPALHFAGNSGKKEKPVRIEDTIDTIVMKTTNEDVRERNVNKSISLERKPGDINTIADTVYKLIERRLLIEKEKRGLV
ncbi:hypothetical protein [Candidatus Methanoperedens nitratireducens]|uniref:Uncharacterized protein n=1 Tax=Candidatus Methanoperedens nitratireducens TaxID=1392998 RepID=A0A284VRQ7_9EURY|nr:hypothetical protein [Candidatus Methanoperedens nitroreducens]SNQ61974.1 hypothetical protein MNV_560020 [Candidatus Methanoperedens nitroreducens]